MSRTVTALLVALLILTGAGPVFPNGNDVYTSETYGFKIRRPDSTWTFAEKLSEDGGTLTASMTSADQKASVYVMVSTPAQEITTEAYRDTKYQSLLAEPKYANVKKEQVKIAGQKAPGLSLDAKGAGGVDITLCQFYVANEGRFYILQCTAVKTDFKKLSQVFAGVLSSFSFVGLSGKKEAGTGNLVARCGSEVQWCADWDTAARRAQSEKKLIIVTAQFQGGFSLQSLDAVKIGPFMDADFVELARERFVVLKLTKSMDAPIRSECVYGMGSATFGTAVLFVKPDGEVVGDTPSFNPFFLYDYAREVLSKCPEYTGTPVPVKGSKPDRAEAFMRRGELEKAQEILEKLTSAEGLRLKAQLCRRLRRGKDALEAIEAARAKKRSSMNADLLVDEAVILLRTGDCRKAIVELSEAVKKHPMNERVPEAMYWLGACVRSLTGESEKDGWWEKLVDKHPESRWAWKAAAGLAVAALDVTRPLRLEWPDEAVVTAMHDRKPEMLGISEVEKARKDAISFLLKAQRDDGSWITPFDLSVSSASIPLRDAQIALCGSALLAYMKEDSKAGSAVKKAVEFLAKSFSERKGKKREEFYMDYEVWGYSCTLSFFAGCLSAGIGNKGDLSGVMTELMQELQQKQRPGGGWSYYISASLAKGYKADDRSISFVTAGVVLSLLDAKDSGVAVPETMLRRALDCLENMRNGNGSFTYFYDHRNPGAKDSNLPGSAGRVPLCELALYRGKRGSLERVRQGLDIFMRYRLELSGQRGKALMHTGRHGQGSHYIMFDYANAAAAIRNLPEAQQGKYREALLELILAARTEEGSFLGTPLLGYCYGTAMALLSFESLK